jgi:hypothetical protein
MQFYHQSLKNNEVNSVFYQIIKNDLVYLGENGISFYNFTYNTGKELTNNTTEFETFELSIPTDIIYFTKCEYLPDTNKKEIDTEKLIPLAQLLLTKKGNKPYDTDRFPVLELMFFKKINNNTLINIYNIKEIQNLNKNIVTSEKLDTVYTYKNYNDSERSNITSKNPLILDMFGDNELEKDLYLYNENNNELEDTFMAHCKNNSVNDDYHTVGPHYYKQIKGYYEQKQSNTEQLPLNTSYNKILYMNNIENRREFINDMKHNKVFKLIVNYDGNTHELGNIKKEKEKDHKLNSIEHTFIFENGTIITNYKINNNKNNTGSLIKFVVTKNDMKFFKYSKNTSDYENFHVNYSTTYNKLF